MIRNKTDNRSFIKKVLQFFGCNKKYNLVFIQKENARCRECIIRVLLLGILPVHGAISILFFSRVDIISKRLSVFLVIETLFSVIEKIIHNDFFIGYNRNPYDKAHLQYNCKKYSFIFGYARQMSYI